MASLDLLLAEILSDCLLVERMSSFEVSVIIGPVFR